MARWAWRDQLRTGEAVISDIDGVLADASARQHYLTGETKDWKAFFSACDEDPPIQAGKALLRTINPEYIIVLVTGRPYWVYEKTREFLDREEIPWDLLVMRAENDFRPTDDLKRQVLGELTEQGITPVFALDDHAGNVGMFEEAGVPCVHVYSGYYA